MLRIGRVSVTIRRIVYLSYTEVAEYSATPRWLNTQQDRGQRDFLVYIEVSDLRQVDRKKTLFFPVTEFLDGE